MCTALWLYSSASRSWATLSPECLQAPQALVGELLTASEVAEEILQPMPQLPPQLVECEIHELCLKFKVGGLCVACCAGGDLQWRWPLLMVRAQMPLALPPPAASRGPHCGDARFGRAAAPGNQGKGRQNGGCQPSAARSAGMPSSAAAREPGGVARHRQQRRAVPLERHAVPEASGTAGREQRSAELAQAHVSVLRLDILAQQHTAPAVNCKLHARIYGAVHLWQCPPGSVAATGLLPAGI